MSPPSPSLESPEPRTGVPRRPLRPQFPLPIVEAPRIKTIVGQNTDDVRDREYTIEELDENSFEDVDIALFGAGGSIIKKCWPIAAEKSTIVVDNSSAFRMDESVPFVITEVNPEAMVGIKLKKEVVKGI